MEELEKLLEIAVNNYVQLGGVVQAEQRRQHENKNTKRYLSIKLMFQSQQLSEFEVQSKFESVYAVISALHH